MKTAKRIYKLLSITVSVIAVAYFILLCYPNPLFAYSTTYESYTIHSRTEIRREDLVKVLDSAETRLKRSPIYDPNLARDIYLADSHTMYALLSHKAYKSFANSLPLIDNVFINKSDIAADRVFVNREKNNSRSLSGVIAHEITHLLIRQRYGTLSATLMPTWKNEGYCEYVAGDSTISVEEGVRLWRDNPTDDQSYRYIKYHLMVKHLLDDEHVSVDDLFTKSFDEAAVAERTYKSLVAETPRGLEAP